MFHVVFVMFSFYQLAGGSDVDKKLKFFKSWIRI